MTQTALDFSPAPVAARSCSDPQTIDERWAAFHRDHPAVYAAFERLALDAIARGKTRIGAKSLWERMRWEMWLVESGDGPALNNDFVALYARLFIARHPEHADVFEVRRRVSEHGRR